MRSSACLAWAGWDVALKLLPAELASDAKRLRRFVVVNWRAAPEQ